MEDISVMYHYVREKNGWNGIHPLIPEKFEQQLEILSSNYDIVCPDDIERKSNKPKCILSFDDATKDQYTIAFEILKKKGIPGYFTVMSAPLVNSEIPIFHLVHTVLSLYSDEEIWQDLKNEFDLKNKNIESLSSYYSYEKDLLRRFNKYVLNFYLTEQKSRRFLEERVLNKYGNKEKFINEFYVSKNEFLEMKRAGMTIGVHCVKHIPYSGDALAFYKKEIEPCIDFIKEEIGVTPKWYTPAFGGGEKYIEMMSGLENILKKEGFKGGFTTIEGFNNGLSNFWLKRFDCVKLPPVTNLND
ncbi:polysaccharide deacetylase family protein [Heyndrickxia vini]|uniref:Polysaccharide deacetylase family protein n=1 Tax=Heyndrickxia vini TaxID=1476025 RepID=A0ABX7E4S9_9BACI|nr:polysaccharide deacetylase family protein [Heyndrickxia vini]QQZ10279.1 polysaccharide deacetylase family protein [Heyndrickxia vini]